MQLLCLFYNNVALDIFIGAHLLVSLPNFEDIDQSFNFKTCLVPPSNHYDYQRCIQHYNYIDKLLAYRLRNGINNNEIISNEAKETKSELEDCIATSEGFDMTWSMLSSFVPRLWSNTITYDPNDLMQSKIMVHMNIYAQNLNQQSAHCFIFENILVLIN